MSWLTIGLLYSAGHVLIGWLLRGQPVALSWFGNAALLVPPSLAAIVIVRHRRRWVGCQWVFWATFAVGSAMWIVGQIWWAVNELVLGKPQPWLEWHAALNLCGSLGPLLALMARPHRGPRRSETGTTTLDIAGAAILAGFVQSYFVLAQTLAPGETPTGHLSLLILAQVQRTLMFVAMAVAAVRARAVEWGPTYRRLAIGLAVGLAARTLTSLAIWDGTYRTGLFYDLTWILPPFFYAWAAEGAPRSIVAAEADELAPASSTPRLIFATVALVPMVDFLMRDAFPLGARGDVFRDLLTALTMVVVMGLLTIRLSMERAARRRADARLRLMAAAVQQTDDLTLIVSAKCALVHANEAFCRAVGYSRAELEAMSPRDLVAVESRPAFDELGRTARRRGVARGALVRRRKDRSTFSVACTVVPLVDASGAVTHFVGVERDTTEDLRIRDQLVHSERLSAVGQLVSGVAHEINNPLQTIVGFTELMLANEERGDARRDLQRICSEGKRAGKIVRNLLAFVRRSSGGRVRADLNEIVQATFALRAYELRVANIELDERYACDLPAVLIDPEEVQQVILNLVLNAEQAMLAAGDRGRLTVSTSARDSQVAVEIADDGPGVPAALRGRIFEPFFTTKEVGKGTGLGLSIAMGIITSHGGQLELVDAERGACFRVTLPADGLREAVGRPARSPGLGQTGRRALVIDDEPAVRDLLARMLRHRGFDVDAAEDGEAALALVEKTAYSLILCDVRMPRMIGPDLHERIALRRPELRRAFVFITGDAVGADVAAFSRAREIPLLSKPFSSGELDEVLEGLGFGAKMGEPEAETVATQPQRRGG